MRPARETIRNNEFAYFVSTQTAGRKPFFRHDRWARLMLATINHYIGTGYALHAFVIMPDHLHLLITPIESVEKSMQLIKGGFSFRAKKEFEWNGEIWQPGFSDHRIRDEEDWIRHVEYIRSNPVDAKLVEDIALYEFMGLPDIAFPRGLKPGSIGGFDVRAEARTLQSEALALQAEAGVLQSEASLPDIAFPQGLKPCGSGIAIGTAKAMPFQNTDTPGPNPVGTTEVAPFQNRDMPGPGLIGTAEAMPFQNKSLTKQEVEKKYAT
jgi:putative transposase